MQLIGIRNSAVPKMRREVVYHRVKRALASIAAIESDARGLSVPLNPTLPPLVSPSLRTSGTLNSTSFGCKFSSSMARVTKFTLSRAGLPALARQATPRHATHGTFVVVEWKSSLNAIGTKRLRVTVSPRRLFLYRSLPATSRTSPAGQRG